MSMITLGIYYRLEDDTIEPDCVQIERAACTDEAIERLEAAFESGEELTPDQLEGIDLGEAGGDDIDSVEVLSI